MGPDQKSLPYLFPGERGECLMIKDQVRKVKEKFRYIPGCRFSPGIPCHHAMPLQVSIPE